MIKSRTLHKMRQAVGLVASVCACASALAAQPANTLPTGGQVAAGQAAISQSGNTMTVNQASQRAVVNWDTYNVGSNATVNYNQPNNQAVILNRVTSASASQIDGAIKANGTVIISNANGVTFGKGAEVNAGAVVATTMNQSDAEFMSGSNTWSGKGTGKVVNKGKIKVTDANGYVALLAPEVRNQGVILATVSTSNAVVAGAGEKVTLNFSNNKLIGITVDKAALNALIENKRAIEVSGGVIALAAGSANQLMRSVINNTGRISASSMASSGGTVELMAATVNNNGTLAANANGDVGNGGSVKVVANNVNLGSKSDIQANAKTNGDGGHIQIWANEQTTVAGKLSATGGALSGNGGVIGTSAKLSVKFDPALKVDTSAKNGRYGQWTVDPLELTVDAAAANTISNALRTTNVMLDATGSACVGGLANCSSSQTPLINFLSGANIYSANASTVLRVLATGGTINVNNNIEVGQVYMEAATVNVNAGGNINTTGGAGSNIFLVGAQINILGGLGSNGQSTSGSSSAATIGSTRRRRGVDSGLSADDSTYTTNGGNILLLATGDISIGSSATLTANGQNGGTITIVSQAGAVTHSGVVDAVGTSGQGGQITLAGQAGTWLVGALSSVDGATAGGTLQIGIAQNMGSGTTLAPPAIAPPTAYFNSITPFTITSGDVTLANQTGLTANSSTGAGGTLLISGANSTSLIGANLQASGFAQGGTVKIGHDAVNGKLPFSLTTVIDAATSISATQLDTNPANQRGGYIETSGQTLAMLGSINVGRGGMWLIDPTDIVVDSTLATSINTALNANTNVTISTTGCTGVTCGSSVVSSGNGNIYVNSAISGTTGTGALTFTPDAAGAVYLSANIATKGAQTYNGDVVVNGAISLSAGAAAVTITGNVSSGYYQILQIGTTNFTATPATGSYSVSINGAAATSSMSAGTMSYSSGTYTYTPNGTFSGNYLLVGGGGGGGANWGGGGGGGGYLTGASTFSTAITVSIGAGGAGGIDLASNQGTTGGASSMTIAGATTTANGGGGGGYNGATPTNGSAGGSGGGAGGASSGTSGGAGTSGQGNDGGASPSGSGAGGGGGAGGAGGAGTTAPNGGSGGAGLSNAISGAAVYYAAGGGGGTGSGGTAGAGGSGGAGGAGATGTTGSSTAGNATTSGSGGGGGSTNGGNGGNGASGIAIFSGKMTTTTGSLTISSGSRAVTLGASGKTLALASLAVTSTSLNSAIAATVSGATALTFTGAGGAMILSGANTYSGGTTITAGTLQAGSATAFGSGSITVTSGAVLDLNGQTMTSTGGLTLNGTGIYSFGALINSATGAGATYAGLVTLGSASSIIGGSGTIALTNTGTITGSGFALTLGGAAGGSITSIIGTGVGTLTKQDGGTWLLSGANTYSGGTIINSGTLKLGSDFNAAGFSMVFGGGINPGYLESSPLGLGNTTVNAGGTLELNGHSFGSQFISTQPVLTLAGTAASQAKLLNSTTTSVTVYSPITLANAVAAGDLADVIGQQSSGTMALSNISVISDGTGTKYARLQTGVSSTYTGTVEFWNANTYSGGTTVAGGKLIVGTATALGTGSVLVSSGAVLDLYGQTMTSAGALTLNGTGISSSGALMNGSSTAATYGALVSLGSASSINGDTGTIALTNTGTIAGATFGLTLGGAQGGSIASIIGTTSGALTKRDAGTWTLSGANTYTGGTSILAGTLKLGNAAGLGASSGAVSVSSGAVLDLNGQTVANTNALTLNGTGISSNGALVNSSSNAASYAGLVTLGSATSIVGDTGAIQLTNSSTITGAGFGLTLGGAQGGSIASIIGTGSGALTKQDVGMWTLSGLNTYTGITTISGGVLSVSTLASGGVASGIGQSTNAAANLVLNGGTLRYTGTATSPSTDRLFTLGSAGGTLDASGTATLAWSSNGSIVLTAATSPTLTLTGSGAASFASLLADPATSGALTVIKSGTGSWTLSGANTYSGDTTVNAGTLVFGVGYVTTSSAITSSPIGKGNLYINAGGAADVASYGFGTSTQTTNMPTITMSGTDASHQALLLCSSCNGKYVYGQIVLAGISAPANTLVDVIASTPSNTLVISAVISDGGSGNYAGLQIGTSSYNNVVALANGNSSYNGLTSVSYGTLKLNAAGSGSNSPLGTVVGGTVVVNGASLDLYGNTLATAEPLTLNGTGISNGGALKNSYSSTTALTYAGLVTLGSDSTISSPLQALNLSNTGQITCSGSGCNLTFDGGGTISSFIATGAGGLTKKCTGCSGTNLTLLLTKANTYSGATTISGGSLSVQVLADGGVASGIGMSTSDASNLVFNSSDATLTYTTGGDASTNRLFTLNSNATIKNNSIGVLTFSNAGSIVNTTTSAGPYTFTLSGGSSQTGIFNPVLVNGTGTTLAVSVAGGTWTLGSSNTYTGGTTISGSSSTLKISSDANLSAVPSTAATNITLSNGGTLLASGQSSAFTLNANRNISLGTGGGIIANNSTSLALTVAGIISGAGTSLTIGTAANNAGTIILTGANVYSGGTTIQGGATLKFAANSSFICSGSAACSTSNNPNTGNAVQKSPIGGGSITIGNGYLDLNGNGDGVSLGLFYNAITLNGTGGDYAYLINSNPNVSAASYGSVSISKQGNSSPSYANNNMFGQTAGAATLKIAGIIGDSGSSSYYSGLRVGSASYAGLVIFSGSNTYHTSAGGVATLIDTGTLQISKDENLGTPLAADNNNNIKIQNGGALLVSGQSGDVGLSPYRKISLGTGGGTLANNSSSYLVTISSLISGVDQLTVGSTGNLGTIVLSGSAVTATNSYTGSTAVTSGATLDLKFDSTNTTTTTSFNSTYSGAGSIIIEPVAASGTIVLGGTGGTLNLASTLFTGTSGTGRKFADGFANITIGSSSAGNLSVAANASAAFSDSVTLLSGANISINSGASVTTSQAGGNLVVAATGNFLNLAGSSALQTTDAGSADRWIVYSAAPSTDNFGSSATLVSGNKAYWGSTYSTLAPSAVGSGNRYVFSTGGTVTVTTTNASMTYGIPIDLSGNYTASNISLDAAPTGSPYLVNSQSDLFATAPTITSTGNTSTAAVGSYAITGSGAAGATGFGTIAYANTGTLTVNPAVITLGVVGSKTYDGSADFVVSPSNPNVRVSGLANGDTLATVTANSPNVSASGGNYFVSFTMGTGMASNYTLVSGYNATTNAATINPATVTVSATATNMTYGATALPTLAYSAGSLISGNSFSGSLTSVAPVYNSGASTFTANAGVAYPITIGTLSAGGNYSISYTGANLTMVAAPLTVTATPTNMTYGATSLPTLAYTTSALVNGNSSSVLSGSLSTSATPYVAGTSYTGNAGVTYTIDQGSVTAGNNYAITYVPANITMTKAVLNVTGNSPNMVYGASTQPTLSYAYSGYVNGDSSAVGLSGTPTVSSSAPVYNAGASSYTANAGATYAVTPSVSGVTSTNYTFSPVNGTLTMVAAPLTVTATATSMTYGASSVPTLAYTTSALANGNSSSVLSGSLATTATPYVAGSSHTGNAGDTYAITQGTVTAGGNYSITYVPADVTMTKAVLNVTGNSPNMVYGASTQPTLSYAYSGYVNGDSSAAGLSGTPTVSSAAPVYVAGSSITGNAGATYAVTPSVTGVSATNYTFSPVNGTLTITPAPLTVTGSKVYTGNGNFTYSQMAVAGAQNGETISLTAGSATTSSGNVNTYNGTSLSSLAINVTGGNALASNYSLPASGNLSITPATLTYTAAAASSTYGSTPSVNAGNVTGFVGSDTQANATTGTMVFSTAASASSNVGSYAINGTGLTANNGNYTFIQAAGNSSALTVNPATLTYTATAANSTYGSTPSVNAGTVTGFVNGETQAGATTGTLLFSTTASNASNVGSYAINGTGLTANNGNYTFVQAAGNSTALTVNPATLTYTATAANSTYGSTPSVNAGTVTGFVNNETQAGATTGTMQFATSATASSNVGGYAINGAGLAANNGNYTFVQAAGNATALTVNPAQLTITGTKVYDGNGNFTYSQMAVAGAQNSETVSLTAGSATTSSGNVNTYNGTSLSSLAINVTGGNALASNYSLPASGSLSITPATLTYTAAAANSTYGSTPSVNAGTVTGFVGSDTQANATTGTLLFSTAATSGSNVGSYAINGTGLTANNGNYTFVQAAGNATALTVNPAPLTITGTKVYDGNGNFTYSQMAVAGTQNGETVSLTAGSATTSSANINTYNGITLSGLAINVNGGNALASNYSLPASGNLSITQRSITVTADAQSTTYGTALGLGTTAYTVGGSGLASGDAINAVTLQYNGSANVPSNTNAATYNNGIVASGATGSGGFNTTNYAITYGPGNLVVNQKALSVTATATNMTYGATALPTLAYTSNGLVNGDTLSGSLATTAPVYNAGLSTRTGNVGNTYAMTQGTLSASSNYALTYTPADITVVPATLTVTANNQSRVYGNANSTLTQTISGFVNGDNSSVVSGTAYGSTTATTTTGVGSATITATNSGLSASNYNFNNLVNGTLSITARPITLTASAQTTTYGTALGLGTTAYTTSGGTLASGDAISAVTLQYNGSPTVPATTDAGTYSNGIVASGATGTSGFNSTNYAITYVPANLVVNKQTLTITADSATKVYGSTATYGSGSTAFTTNGLVNGQTVGSVTITDTNNGGVATANAGGTYYLTPSAATGGTFTPANYNITYVPGVLTVSQAPLNIAVAKTYDGTATLHSYDHTVLTTTGGIHVYDAQITGTVTTSSSNVGSYASFVSGGFSLVNSPNYTLVGGTTTATINVKIVNASGTKNYDASTAFGYTQLTVNSGVAGEMINLTGGSGTASSANVATYSNAPIAGVTFTVTGGNALASNYVVSTVGTLTITPRPITLTATSQSTTYGTALGLGTTAYTVGGSGLASGDAINAVTLQYNGSANVPGNTNAATYGNGIGASGATGSGGFNTTNYAITYAPGTLTVNAAPLTITGTKVYDGNGNFTYSQMAVAGAQNGETISLTAGSATTSSGNVNSYNGTSLSSLAINVTGGNVLASNYSLPASGTLSITQRSITLTANAQSTTYGTALGLGTTAYTVGGIGLASGDAINAVTLQYNGSATVPGNTNAATYNNGIVASGATGSGGFNTTNYAITYAPGNLVVDPKPVTITNIVSSTTYDATSSYAALMGTAGYAHTALVGSDAIGSVTQTATVGGNTVAGVAQAGSFTATPSAAVLSTGTASNYAFTYVAASDSVAKANLAVTATQSLSGNIYNGSAYTGSYTTTLLGSDTATVTGMATGTDAGTYTSNLQVSGSALSNYNTPVITNANLVISPKTITVSGQAANNKTYDGTITATINSSSAGLSGVVNGDAVTLDASAASGTFASANAANGIAVTVTGNTLGGVKAGNYTLLQPTGVTANITPATLTYTAMAANSTYGSAPSVNAGTVTGFVNNETQASATMGTLAFTTTATSSSNVGSYGITGSGLIANNGNYIFVQAAGNSSALTVSARPITVTADAQSTTFGTALGLGTSAYTLSSGTLASGDAISAVTLQYNGNATVPGTTIAGTYTNGIVPSGAVGTGGFNAINYAISYLPADLTVLPQPQPVPTSSSSSAVFRCGFSTQESDDDGVLNYSQCAVR